MLSVGSISTSTSVKLAMFCSRLTLIAALAAHQANAAPQKFPVTAPVQFVVIGDSGTGGASQYAVARAIRDVCAQRGCQFAIVAGDNIYEYGVNSNNDHQFQSKFEKPYADLAFPFFIALGNHDQSGLIAGSGTHPEKGDYQVEYTLRSSKWMLPKRYYQFAAPFADPSDYTARNPEPVIEFFVIDTNPLAPQNMPQYDWYRPHQKYDREQRAWLRSAIASSNARWKAVVGHHPYRNNGTHGNAGDFFGLGLSKGRELKTMYEQEVCNKVDFLFSGHDHSLQWLAPYAACGSRPQFLISGAAAQSNGPEAKDPIKRSNHALWEGYHIHGFFWLEATAEQIKISIFAVDKEGQFHLAFERVIHRD